jgi:hypothetical protein
MKRTEKEISEYQAEVAKLNRMINWNAKEAERYTAQANRKVANSGKTADYYFARGTFHEDEVATLKKKLEQFTFAYEHPPLMARIKRFLFNI